MSEQELAEIWQACRDDDYGHIIKLLILTGQRRGEIGDLSWSEIDFEKAQIDLPSARTKNKLPHIVPLSTAAMGIIRNLPRHTDRDLVFGEGEGGFQGWARAKRSLDVRVNAQRRQTGKKTMPDWVIHDLRRSVNTLLNEKGIAQPHIVEAIMNHVSGHKANVAGVYNKANYLSEKRQSLETWGNYWSTFVEGCDA